MANGASSSSTLLLVCRFYFQKEHQQVNCCTMRLLVSESSCNSLPDCTQTSPLLQLGNTIQSLIDTKSSPLLSDQVTNMIGEALKPDSSNDMLDVTTCSSSFGSGTSLSDISSQSASLYFQDFLNGYDLDVPSPLQTHKSEGSIPRSPPTISKFFSAAGRWEIFSSKSNTFCDDLSTPREVCQAPPTSPQTSSFEIAASRPTSPSDEFSKILSTYYNMETLLDQPDGRSVLREYVKKRRNEEMLLYLEVQRTFKKIECTNSTDIPSPRVTNILSSTNALILSPEFLKVKEFKLIYNQFISLDSRFCINIDHSIRDRFVTLNSNLDRNENSKGYEKEIYEKLVECLDHLHLCISLKQRCFFTLNKQKNSKT